MIDPEYYDKWLIAAARYEGVIEAHRIMKQNAGDPYDDILWNMATEIQKELDNG
jgi:hypothetical protein